MGPRAWGLPLSVSSGDDVLVADAFVVGLGDEADAQRMRAQTIKSVDTEPGHADAVCQDSPNGIGMQRAGPMRSPVLMRRNSGPALRLATACQASKARTGTGFRQFAAWQADLGPLPRLVGLAAANAQPQATSVLTLNCRRK